MGAAYLQPYLENAATPKTAFGEGVVAENYPFIQAAFNYNLLPSNFRAFTATGGSTTVAGGMAQVSTGTSVGGYGAIQSFRSLNYKPGEGGLARFTAIFNSGVALTWQGAGLISIGNELSFGYNGTEFGIWHRYDGLAEVQTITVTGGSGGSTDLTLTLNSVAYTIPLTSGSTSHNAYEIANWLNDSANQTIWKADNVGATVIVAAQSDGAKAGTYSFSHGSATGSIAQDTAGVTKTSDFVAQSSWNGDKFDGTGASGVTIDTTKGNVYQIEYQYLGFGNIHFLIEDPNTGRFVTAHTIKYANANTTPSLNNPSMRLGIYCASVGGTTNITVKSGSMAGFTQGKRVNTRNPRAKINTQSVGSSAFTTILAIRNRRTYNGLYNQVEIEPEILTISAEGAKDVQIEIRSVERPNVELIYTNVGTDLVSDVATDAVTFTGGRLLAAFAVPAGGSEKIDLSALKIRIPPSLNFIISGKRGSGSANDVTAALTWYEDV